MGLRNTDRVREVVWLASLDRSRCGRGLRPQTADMHLFATSWDIAVSRAVFLRAVRAAPGAGGAGATLCARVVLRLQRQEERPPAERPSRPSLPGVPGTASVPTPGPARRGPRRVCAALGDIGMAAERRFCGSLIRLVSARHCHTGSHDPVIFPDVGAEAAIHGNVAGLQRQFLDGEQGMMMHMKGERQGITNGNGAKGIPKLIMYMGC